MYFVEYTPWKRDDNSFCFKTFIALSSFCCVILQKFDNRRSVIQDEELKQLSLEYMTENCIIGIQVVR